MKTKGLSQKEEDWLMRLVGNNDPDNRLVIRKFPNGYQVEVKPSPAELLLALSQEGNCSSLRGRVASSELRLDFSQVISKVAQFLGN